MVGRSLVTIAYRHTRVLNGRVIQSFKRKGLRQRLEKSTAKVNVLLIAGNEFRL